MEKHKTLSIFIPHEGCPNQCSFCDQRKISGSQNPPTALQVEQLCQEFLPMEKEKGAHYEIGFFGGSFTAIDYNYMLSLLNAAYPFILQGRAKGVRISTRPDAINQDILSTLKQYGVTAIELGAQSMQDDVLKLNLRGHTANDVYNAARLIKENGFSLGLQMMTGLYGQKNYMEYAIDTANKFIQIKPDTVRIYPTITLKDTMLADVFNKGEYIPASLEESVEICAKLVSMFDEKNIKIIKLGLHADKGIEENMVAGPYHQAFKEVVLAKIYFDKFYKQLSIQPKGNYTILVPQKKLSQAMGQNKYNQKQLSKFGYNVNFKTLDLEEEKEFIILSEE